MKAENVQKSSIEYTGSERKGVKMATSRAGKPHIYSSIEGIQI